jgi:hypothetical protein
VPGSIVGSDVQVAPRVLDLRGAGDSAPALGALADPSGGRARRVRALGRGVATLLLLWMVGLILAGLGLLPRSAPLLGGSVGGSDAPPGLARLPVATPPTASDLLPARPAASSTAAPAGTVANRTLASAVHGGTTGVGQGSKHRRKPIVAASGPVSTVTPGPSTLLGSPPAASSPSHVHGGGTTKHVAGTTHSPTTAPGQAKKVVTVAPGRGRTTTTTPGKSGSAPGRAHKP